LIVVKLVSVHISKKHMAERRALLQRDPSKL
jgi:hypothetical protein